MEYIRITKEFYTAAAETEAVCLDTSWSASQIAEAAESADYVYVAATENGALWGVCSCVFSADDGEILNLAVRPEMRRRGVGRGLLCAVAEAAKEKGCMKLVLEVASRNEAAIALYTSVGFVKAGLRKNFYPKQKDDAVIMVSKL